MVKSPEKTSKKFMEIEKRYKKQPAMMSSCDKIGINQNLADLLPRTDDRRRLIGQHPVSSVSSLTWLFKFVHVQSVLFNGKLVTITSMATTHGIGFMCITFLLVITKWHWQRLLLFAVIDSAVIVTYHLGGLPACGVYHSLLCNGILHTKVDPLQCRN